MKKLIVILLLSLLVFIGCQEETKYSNEGSQISPVVLTVDSPHNATIAPWGINYYKFTTAAAANHTISLINVDSDLSWELYSDSSYSSFVAECDDYWYTEDESDTVFLNIGTYYLLVIEWDYVGGAFTVSVTSP